MGNELRFDWLRWQFLHSTADTTHGHITLPITYIMTQITLKLKFWNLKGSPFVLEGVNFCRDLSLWGQLLSWGVNFCPGGSTFVRSKKKGHILSFFRLLPCITQRRAAALQQQKSCVWQFELASLFLPQSETLILSSFASGTLKWERCIWGGGEAAILRFVCSHVVFRDWSLFGTSLICFKFRNKMLKFWYNVICNLTRKNVLFKFNNNII